jgi:hypothetical protein
VTRHHGPEAHHGIEVNVVARLVWNWSGHYVAGSRSSEAGDTVIDRLSRRVTTAIGIVVVAALGIRFSAWVLAPIWPAIVILAATIFIINIALRKR